MVNKWTKEEDEFLVKNYKSLKAIKCGELLSKSAASVRTRASRLGITSSKRQWSEEDDEQLKTIISSGVSYDKIAKTLNRTYAAISARASHLGLQKDTKDKWSNLTKEDAITIVRKHKTTTSIKESTDAPSTGTLLKILEVDSWTEAQKLAQLTKEDINTYASNTSCSFYIIEFIDNDGTSFKKFGLTRNTLKTRYKGRKDYKILYYKTLTLDQCRELEKSIQNCIVKYIPKDDKFRTWHGGASECFTEFTRVPSWL